MQLANHGGVTPLHEAAAGGHKAAAEALLSIGATNDAVDQVRTATSDSSIELCSYLASLSAKPKLCGSEAATFLKYSSEPLI